MVNLAIKGHEDRDKDVIKISIPKDYEFTGVINQQVVFTKIQSKYPKTYEECCKIIGFSSNTLEWDNPFSINRDTHPYIKHLDNSIESFYKLLVCRDAYWKIAGEKMGLGKPWEPRDAKDKYIIRRAKDTIVKGYNISCVLEFPTEEIRDAFFENFGHLIELCKELL